jgi:hypothetical protein
VKRARLVVVVLLAGTVLAAAACKGSVSAPLALEEPIRVSYLIGSTPYPAQFFAGDLPQPGGGPAIAGVDIGPDQAAPGKQGKGGYTVRVDKSAFAVAVRLQGRTNGYWIARIDQIEPLFENQVSAALVFDIAPRVTPGKYDLELSGVSGDRQFGPRTTAPLDIVPRVPTNAPVVIRLRWDNVVDLDLQVKAPDGTLLSPKHPTTAAPTVPDAGTAPGYGRLLGDSMASCVDDGLREEDVVFDAPPLPGKYDVYVNPFSLCGEQGTAYDVSILKSGNIDQRFFGTVSQVEVQQGGFGVGNFVTEVSF